MSRAPPNNNVINKLRQLSFFVSISTLQMKELNVQNWSYWKGKFWEYVSVGICQAWPVPDQGFSHCICNMVGHFFPISLHHLLFFFFFNLVQRRPKRLATILPSCEGRGTLEAKKRVHTGVDRWSSSYNKQTYFFVIWTHICPASFE